VTSDVWSGVFAEYLLLITLQVLINNQNMRSMLYLADGLQQQKTLPGTTHLHYK